MTIDIVPNHTSDQHEWFRNAIADPNHPQRAYYFFRPGRAGGRPNGWTSAFGGPAWTLDEATGDYYLHFFAPEQPDLDWHNEDVQAEFEHILRFWLDRGVDGFRIDVAHALFKAQDLREMVEPVPRPDFGDWLSALMQPELHPLYRRWRADRRRVSRRPDVRRRDRDREPGEDRELRRPRPAAPVLQLRAPLRAVGRRAHARDDRQDARRRSGRSAHPRPGCSRTTTSPGCQHATAAARSGSGGRAPRRCSSSACRGRVHLPGPGARARGGRAARTRSARTRSSSARTAPGRGATAAACRFRGRRSRRPSDSRTASPGCRCRRTGARSASRRRKASRTRCSSSSAPRSRLRPRGDGFAWRESPPGTMVFERGDVVCAVNFDAPELELPEGEILLASEPGITTTLPPNTAAWIKRGAGG